MQELKQFCKERIKDIKKQNMLWMHLLAQTAEAEDAHIATPAAATTAATPAATNQSLLHNVARLTRIKAPTDLTSEFLQFMNGGDLGKRKSKAKRKGKSKAKRKGFLLL